jgi:hypothetical protein
LTSTGRICVIMHGMYDRPVSTLSKRVNTVPELEVRPIAWVNCRFWQGPSRSSSHARLGRVYTTTWRSPNGSHDHRVKKWKLRTGAPAALA